MSPTLGTSLRNVAMLDSTLGVETGRPKLPGMQLWGIGGGGATNAFGRWVEIGPLALTEGLTPHTSQFS